METSPGKVRATNAPTIALLATVLCSVLSHLLLTASHNMDDEYNVAV